MTELILETNYPSERYNSSSVDSSVSPSYRCADRRIIHLRRLVPTASHPIDLFLIISVLQANFYWIEDFEEMICPWLKKIILGV